MSDGKVQVEQYGGSTQGPAEVSSLGLLLHAQHAELLSRLDAQEQLISKLLHKDVVPFASWDAATNHACEAAMLGDTSMCASPTNQQSSSDVRPEASFDSKVRKTASTAKTFTDSMTPNAPCESEISPCRSTPQIRCRRLISSPLFEIVFAVLIIINSIFMGVEVEFQAMRGINAPMPWIFLVITHLFGGIFLVELVIRIIADGREFCTNDRWAWNLFDTILVVCSIIDVVVEIFDGKGATGSISSMRLIRIVRITRLVRLLRLARWVRLVRALSVLVHSILHTLKALIWAVLLLSFNIYFFAIIFTQTALPEIKDCFDDETCQSDQYILRTNWSSVPRSMLTLFETISGGVDWDNVARPIGRIHGVWMAVFICYVVLTLFAMLNVITGVFCQSAIEGANLDRDLMVKNLLENKQVHVNNIKAQFKAMFETIDTNGTGTIDMKEFEVHLNDENADGFFVLLDIDTSDAWTLFRLLDRDDSDVIDAEEFVDGCLKLKGPARAIEMACMQKELARTSQKISALAGLVDHSHRVLRREVAELVTSAAVVPPPPLAVKKTHEVPATCVRVESSWEESAAMEDRASEASSPDLPAPRDPPAPAPPPTSRRPSVCSSSQRSAMSDASGIHEPLGMSPVRSLA